MFGNEAVGTTVQIYSVLKRSSAFSPDSRIRISLTLKINVSFFGTEKLKSVNSIVEIYPPPIPPILE